MLATRRGEKKLTRKVMMLQTIEAEHSFKVKQSEWLGVWAEQNHRTRRRRTGLSWLEYTVVTRDLSVCLSVTVTNGNASRDSLRSRPSPLSNCWLVANVGIPVCSGTTPLRSTRHHCCYCRTHCCDRRSDCWTIAEGRGWVYWTEPSVLPVFIGLPSEKCCNFQVLKQFKGCHWRLIVLVSTQ